jgi:hypothetical protein
VGISLPGLVSSCRSFFTYGLGKKSSVDDLQSVIFRLRQTVSKSFNSNEIDKAKITLREIKDEVLEEGDSLEVVINDVILVADLHLHVIKIKEEKKYQKKYEQERDKVLNRLSNEFVSLEEIDLSAEKNCLLNVYLGGSLNQGFSVDVKDYSLKYLCSNVHSLSNRELSKSIKVAKKLIESLKNQENLKDLIDFCLSSPLEGLLSFYNSGLKPFEKVQLLFKIIHYLGLDEFQKNSLEPFLEKFPGIPLNQVPKTIKYLNLFKRGYLWENREEVNFSEDVEKVDFSRFEALEELKLCGLEKIRAKHFNSIPNKSLIKVLFLERMSVIGFDFSSFKGLRELRFSTINNLTVGQFNSIPNKRNIKCLTFGINNIELNLSGFTSLEVLDLRESISFKAEQFNTIPVEVKSSIKELNLRYNTVADFEFSEFNSLTVLNLGFVLDFTADQFNTISSQAKSSIETLDLSCLGLDFMGEIRGQGVEGFDFSEFISLKTLVMKQSRGVTANLFNTIPLKAKSSIEILDLSFLGSYMMYIDGEALIMQDAGVAGFDFSEFTALRELRLSGVYQFTAAQFNAISENAKCSIRILDLSEINVTGFDFSGFTGLKEVNLSRSIGLTAMALNSMSEDSKESMESFNLSHTGVDLSDLSGFTNLKPHT